MLRGEKLGVGVQEAGNVEGVVILEGSRCSFIFPHMPVLKVSTCMSSRIWADALSHLGGMIEGWLTQYDPQPHGNTGTHNMKGKQNP